MDSLLQRSPRNYRPIGAVTRDTAVAAGTGSSHIWHFRAEDGTRTEVTVLQEDLARVRLLPAGLEPARSWAVVGGEGPIPATSVSEDSSGVISLTTSTMSVLISTQPFRVAFSWLDGVSFAVDDEVLGMGYAGPYGPDDIVDTLHPEGSVRCYKRLPPGEHILGAGECTAPLDRRGQHIVYWNTDPPQPHGDQTRSMYVSIPFWMGLRAGRCYGIFFDTTWRSDLDAGASRPDLVSFGARGGDLTYYVLAGPTIAQVLDCYAALTGRLCLPPRWALGYGQSRWTYYPEEAVRAVATNFRDRSIPCDSLWLDIDYMDGYRDFTWSPRRFPEPDKLIGELREAGYKVITIIDPCVKADPTDPTFTDGLEHGYFLHRADGSLYTGEVWPGDCAFPDFSRADVRLWWGELHRPLLDTGIAAIWNDMNEPSLTDRFILDSSTPQGSTLPADVLHYPDGPAGAALSHEAFHNAYGLQMARATYEALARLRPDRRPFVLTRSGYAGIQRYASIWTGDNQSAWEHLRLASRMSLALGLSGMPLVGFDTGGFWENATGPLLVRFTQLGAVFPFFRNHSAMETESQEPWAFGQPFEALCRRAIELRYRLLPYVYTVVAEAMRTGAPIARALIYAYPDDEALVNVDDQHLLGKDLLCAPVVEDNQPQRIVAFPRGAWIDWETGERFTGPQRRRVDSPLDVLPLFVREGAVIPLGPVMQYTGELVEEPLTLACYLAEGDEYQQAVAQGELYEDDGETPAYQEGRSRLVSLTAIRSGLRVTFRAESPSDAYIREWSACTVEFHLPYLPGNRRPEVESAAIDGRALDQKSIRVTLRRYETLLSVPIPSATPPCELQVTLLAPD
ncbi:MAG: alpha-glucosidase [Chloroflexi bacterium]|nr:MAG: alpha-glucosidase [Chloroflexota bacterium]